MKTKNLLTQIKIILLYLLYFSLCFPSILPTLAHAGDDPHYLKSLKTPINWGDDSSKKEVSRRLALMSARYAELRIKKKFPLPLEIESQRLINPVDWQKASKIKHINPCHFYTAKTIESWLDGLNYINTGNHPVTVETLKKIHKLVYKSEFFWGYEYRRAGLKGQEGREEKTPPSCSLTRVTPLPPSKEEMIQQLSKSVLRNYFPQCVTFSGTDHSTLLGQFRLEEIDRLEFWGANSVGLTDDELNYVKSRPDLYQIEGKGEKTPDGRTKIDVYFKTHPDMEKIIDGIITHTYNVLIATDPPPTLVDKFEAAVKMQREIIAHHPFLDGNGRTTRLFTDFIFRMIGLPPALSPNEKDLTMTPLEHADFTLRSMEDYLQQAELQ